MATTKHVEHRIRIHVPVRVAYDQWTQFEEFPKFMEGVERVHQGDDTHLEWHAAIAGKRIAWTSEIVRQEPDRQISWRSTSGPFNSGTVSFRPISAGETEVTLRLDYEPEGMLQQTGDALGFVQRRVRGDLERFKEFLEARGEPTGAWRGRVEGGRVEGGRVEQHHGASTHAATTTFGGASRQGSSHYGAPGHGGSGRGSMGQGSSGDVR